MSTLCLLVLTAPIMPPIFWFPCTLLPMGWKYNFNSVREQVLFVKFHAWSSLFICTYSTNSKFIIVITFDSVSNALKIWSLVWITSFIIRLYLSTYSISCTCILCITFVVVVNGLKTSPNVSTNQLFSLFICTYYIGCTGFLVCTFIGVSNSLKIWLKVSRS